MKVLVVDDHAYNRDLLAFILDDEGHTCIEAVDGKNAVEIYRDDPDIALILMDINMPEMDGIEATRAIKSLDPERFVPVIFVTALDDTDVIARCLDAGGDDFVPKPVNENVLISKINAHARSQALYQNLQQANKTLSYHQTMMNREHSIVEHIFSNANRRNKTYCENIKQYTSPVSMFDGDVVLSGPSPAGGVYLMVGDFTGHGLAAAIGSLPVTEIFHNMISHQASISQLASVLNVRLHEILPTNMFCCATLMFIDASGTQCTLWSGGMNDTLWVKSGSGTVEKIVAQHMPLGILDDAEFDDSPLIFEISLGDKLYIYTDGVNEAVNASGEEFGLERLEEVVAKGGDDTVEAVNLAVKQFHEGCEQSDDISIVEVTGGSLVHRSRDDDEPVDVQQEFHRASSFPWHLKMHLEDEDLRNTSIVNQILGFVASIQGIELHQDKIFTIVSELYSNSLEHGVLRLSSEMKNSADGFEQYYRERQLRLESLQQQFIDVEFDYLRGNPNKIKLVITDSGDGFDIDKVFDSTKENDQTHGRGLSLLRSLCSVLQYADGGRTVTAVYDLCHHN